MASAQTRAVWQQFRRLLGPGPVAGLTEAELLDRYAIGRDEAAFEALVALHGAMVVGVCRRMLDDPEDVEDAFQATFLVLVRRAGALGQGVAVGPWLYGVACRVAMRARSTAARRRSRERTLPAVVDAVGAEGPAMDHRGEIAEALDRELAALPASYRAAVVLCDLEGRTHAEAARQLGWPVGTVKGRLARARELLRGRLARRGVAPTASALAVALEVEAGAAVPSAWAAVALAAGHAVSGEALAGSVSAPALALAEGVLKAMRLHHGMIIAATFAATLVVAAGAAALAQRPEGPEEPAKAPLEPQVKTRVETPRPAPAGPATALPEGGRPAGGPPLETPDDGRPRAKSKAVQRLEQMAAETRLEKRNEAILGQLEQQLTMSFPQETPLEDVLKYIKSSTANEELDLPSGIPIYVDPLGLQEVEKTLTSTVSLDLEGIPLGRTLHLMLRQLDLDYFIEGGLLIITSKDSNDPALFRHDPRPPQPSPLMQMQLKAERGELDAAQRKEFLAMLKDLKEINALLNDWNAAKPAVTPPTTPEARRAQ